MVWRFRSATGFISARPVEGHTWTLLLLVPNIVYILNCLILFWMFQLFKWKIENNNFLFLYLLGLPDTPTLAEWLTKNMKTGSTIGVDANLITYSEWRRINKEIKYKGVTLVPFDTNLIDRMWTDRPAIPSNPVKPLNIKFTGIIFV